MKKLEKLKLHDFDEICVDEQESMKGGGEWVWGGDRYYLYPGETVVIASRYNEPFSLWGPGSVFGINNWDYCGSAYEARNNFNSQYFINGNYSIYNGGCSVGGGSNSGSVGYNGAPIYAAYGTAAYAVELAMTYEGKFNEIIGNESNPTILEFLKYAGISGPLVNDSTSGWCAAFVNYIRANSGLAVINSAQVSDWQKFGHSTTAPQPGDVYFSGNEHIGIVVAVNGDRVTVISGNSNTGSSPGTVHSYETSLNNFTYRTDGNH